MLRERDGNHQWYHLWKYIRTFGKISIQLQEFWYAFPTRELVYKRRNSPLDLPCTQSQSTHIYLLSTYILQFKSKQSLHHEVCYCSKLSSPFHSGQCRFLGHVHSLMALAGPGPCCLCRETKYVRSIMGAGSHTWRRKSDP